MSLAEADGLTIRPLRAEDLEWVCLWEPRLFPGQAWSKNTYLEELAQPGRAYYAALLGTRPVGWAGIDLGEDSQVMTIGVLEDARRRGVGSALLQTLLERAREAGARAVFLEVRASGHGARALYEKEGFTAVGIRKRYYSPGGEDAVVMRKKLRTGPGPIGAELDLM